MKATRRGFLRSVAGAVGAAPFLGLDSARAETLSVQKRKFGRHDEMVSVVGLGGQTLGLASNIEEARRIARHAIDVGITFFDNAWDYHGGRAEEWMGYAIADGWRDKVFLMTKVCTHGKPLPEGGLKGAMTMLEQSLKRLGTDHLDLWMIHQIENDAEVEKAYGPEGVIEALELAKKQGKVRYTGFTGHTDPEAHVKILQGGYDFDATLMPVSALGALSSRKFEEVVMPECVKRNVAVLGMKGFGGSRRAHLHGLVNPETVLRYSLSYPQVCTHLIGMDKYEFIDQAALASAKTPMTPAEREAFTVAVAAQGGAGYACYLQEGYRDGGCGGDSAVA
jgi:aryl-alcohol dehydrogenase-like predicted oxidoreductase